MYVLRWIMANPITSILAVTGLIAIANWGNIYPEPQPKKAITEASVTVVSDSSSDAGVGAATTDLVQAQEVASEISASVRADSNSGLAVQPPPQVPSGMMMTPPAVPPVAVVAPQMPLPEVPALSVIAPATQQSAEGVGALVPMPDVASSPAADEGHKLIAVAEESASDGAASVFDFFKRSKSEEVVVDAEEHASVDAIQIEVAPAKVDASAGDEGKQSLFDFFKRDKSDQLVEVPSGPAVATAPEVAAEADSNPLDSAPGQATLKLEVPPVETAPIEAYPEAVAVPAVIPSADEPEKGSVSLLPLAGSTLNNAAVVVDQLPVVAPPAEVAPVADLLQLPAQAEMVSPPQVAYPAQNTQIDGPTVSKQVIAETPAASPLATGVVAPVAPMARDHLYGSLLQARQAFWRQDYDASYAIYKNLVDASPSHPDLLGEFGNLLVQMGRYEEAVTAYEQSVQSLIQQRRFRDAHPLVGFIGSIDRQRALVLVEQIRSAE